jgi:hypothetical protein
VFWVHASNAARIEQGYRDIADQVKLSGGKDPQADMFGLVHNWLRNQKNGKWLLVLDNADDAAAFSTPTSNGQKTEAGGGDGARPRYCLPQSNNGSVLLTSRTRSVALQLVEESDIISVKPMDDADAQALLHKKLGEEIGNDGIAELAVALELMPLALVQAATYIRQRAPLCSIRQYLEDFYKSDAEKTSLLNREAGHLRRDSEAKNSVITTWQISFDHVRQVRPSAADLLSLMSLFDRQGIPQFLLDRPYKAADIKKRQTSIFSRFLRRRHALGSALKTSGSKESSSKEHTVSSFTDEILTLRNYSFVAVGTDGVRFEMHALVQLATRKWLEAHGHLEQWKQQYIKSLNIVLPEGDYKDWITCQTLYPHAKSVEAHKSIAKSSLQEWASILDKAARYALETGTYNEAERMFKRLLVLRKRP